MERFRPWPITLMGVLALSLFTLSGCSGGSSSTSSTNTAQGVIDRDSSSSPTDSPSENSGETPGSGGSPTAELSADEEVVGSGDDVRLTWSSSNTDTCQASGGWSGVRGTSGSLTVGPVTESTTFTLTCSGAGGSAVAMISVSVLGVVTLSWQAPKKNEDGTALTDLAGYRIYYGEESRAYSDDVEVPSADITAQDVVLPSGSYYFAMTAMDAEGNESAYSNEVVKIVN